MINESRKNMVYDQKVFLKKQKRKKKKKERIRMIVTNSI